MGRFAPLLPACLLIALFVHALVAAATTRLVHLVLQIGTR